VPDEFGLPPASDLKFVTPPMQRVRLWSKQPPQRQLCRRRGERDLFNPRCALFRQASAAAP
jgi:hypothetical protein